MGIFSRIFGKTSQKSDDMVWADEFTLQMGLEFDDLFGIFAMPQSFADAPRLLKIFHELVMQLTQPIQHLVRLRR